MIRDTIVDAVVAAPDVIRIQLLVCIKNIIKHDFPGNWSGLIDKVALQFQTGDPSATQGGLLILYQLVKNYEYKKKEERAPLDEVMVYLLPQLVDLFRKTIFKIFYAFTQYNLPTNV